MTGDASALMRNACSFKQFGELAGVRLDKSMVARPGYSDMVRFRHIAKRPIHPVTGGEARQPAASDAQPAWYHRVEGLGPDMTQIVDTGLEEDFTPHVRRAWARVHAVGQ